MAFESDRLKAIGGQDNRQFGGNRFTYVPTSDTLATVIADNFFDDAYQNLQIGDEVAVYASSAWQRGTVTASTSSGVTIGWSEQGLSAIQELSGPGAVDITSRRTNVTSTGTDALTLADGAFIGQEKYITLIVDGGTATLTPATALGWATAAFADAGDTIYLEWTATGWVLNGIGGLGGGPVIA